MVLAKTRQADQWNGIKDSAINPHTYGYLIFYKDTRNIEWGGGLSSTNSDSLTGYLCVDKCQ